MTFLFSFFMVKQKMKLWRYLKNKDIGRIDLYGNPMEIFPIIEVLWEINKVLR